MPRYIYLVGWSMHRENCLSFVNGLVRLGFGLSTISGVVHLKQSKVKIGKNGGLMDHVLDIGSAPKYRDSYHPLI